MKIRRFIICAAVILFAVIVGYFGIQKKHTFTLSNGNGIMKSEQIQPVFGTVRVSGDSDTDVIFTDIETGRQYVVGYITHGVTENIKLEKGKWYTVEGRGNIKLRPVNVRIE